MKDLNELAKVDLHSIYGTAKKKAKKRVKLTSSQRGYVWEHPKMYGRKCHICGERITKQSDMELDHTRPHSKGGRKMNLAHKECNRMKGTKGLKHIQQKMKLKTAKKKVVKKKTKKKVTKKVAKKRTTRNSFGSTFSSKELGI